MWVTTKPQERAGGHRPGEQAGRGEAQSHSRIAVPRQEQGRSGRADLGGHLGCDGSPGQKGPGPQDVAQSFGGGRLAGPGVQGGMGLGVVQGG